jgi:predicted membrane-bound spermidine synthase/Na+-translocating ferredoxin:NAD+ oxidoreductase RnfG subunit
MMITSGRRFYTVIRYALIFFLGFFALAVQSILFRDFLTMYEGSELGIGLFFLYWLLWVAAGALLGRIRTPITGAVIRKFELLPLLYIPAYVLQHFLIFNARIFAGIKGFDLFPFVRMLPVSLLSCAPVSLCTGVFFTLSCRWITEGVELEESSHVNRKLPVPLLYIMEVGGSVCGGIVVTVMFTGGLSHETVFLISALLLVIGTGSVCLMKKNYIMAIIPFLLITGILMSGFGNFWWEWKRKSTWERLLPARLYEGSFTTSQAEYLYGTYEEQSVVMSHGSVCEVFPYDLYGGQVAAMHLVQCPEAERVLVIGQGTLSVCYAFLSLPGIKEVTWMTQDPLYTTHLLNVFNDEQKVGIEDLILQDGDIKEELRLNKVPYDIVICHLPNVTTLVLNRFFTHEFYTLIKEHITPGGIFSVRTAGGENFFGSELARLGASVYLTLTSVFNHVMIIPGDQSWLCASEREDMSGVPALLEERHGKVEGLTSLFPAEGLAMIYQEERAGLQKDRYRSIIEGTDHELLLNSESWPKALLYTLIFSAKLAAEPVIHNEWIDALIRYGMYIIIGGLFLAGILRLVYRLSGSKVVKSKEESGDGHLKESNVDNYVLLFSQGVLGISTSILLMFMYQSFFGSVFLHIGLLSALFMLGLCLGSIWMRRRLLLKEKESRVTLPLIIICHIILLFLIIGLSGLRVQVLVILTFLVTGVINGCYIPIVTFRFARTGISGASSGAAVEFFDHSGGSAGSVAAGVIMLPLFGVNVTIFILASLLAINLLPLIPALFHRREREILDPYERRKRPVSYILFGIGFFLLFSSFVLNLYGRKPASRAFEEAAKELAGENNLESKNAVLENGKPITYFIVTAEGEENRYIFYTDELVNDVAGYGGPIDMAVMIDKTGVLHGFIITTSHETPLYLQSVMNKLPQEILGRNIVGEDINNISDAITGATVTGEAISRTLSRAADEFSRVVPLLVTEGGEKQAFRWKELLPGGIFLLFVIAALIIRKRPSLWVRRIFLLLIIVVSGILFNIQYSTDHMFNLTRFIVRPVFTGALFFIIAAPILAVLFGNIYCGYLCPFGALQELVGELRPVTLKSDPDKQTHRYTRYIKYVMLFLIVVIFSLTLNPSFLSIDPLINVFSIQKEVIGLIILCGLLALSFFFRRFFCRNLCPTGALLSLLGRIQLLKFVIPRIMPRFCDLGVRSRQEFDCISCDRCRIIQQSAEGKQEQAVPQSADVSDSKDSLKKRLIFMGLVFLFAGILVINGLFSSVKTGTAYETVAEEPGGGTGIPRQVDMDRINSLIRSGQLSDHEALYYRNIGGNE